MAKVQEIGPYSAYAIAKKYGYQGTEEEWIKEQEANRKAAEAAAAAAAQSAKNAAASASGVAQSGQQAVQSIKDAQTAAEQAIDTAKQQAVQAAQAEAEKAATSAGQAASSAAEAAQSATNAAAEVGKVQSAGTSAVQAVQAAQNTATEAVSAAQQTATQTVSEAQATAVSAVQEAGTTQTSAIESAGTAAVADVSNAKTEALSQISAAGTAQVSAVGTAGADAVEDVNDAKTAALEAIDAANAALPVPTVSDAGKVPAVNAEGTGYELSGPYAPLSAAIRPTANGNPVSITDSVEWELQGMNVYGKCSQVSATGAQLFDIEDHKVIIPEQNNALGFACHLIIGQTYTIKANTGVMIDLKISESRDGYNSVHLSNFNEGKTFQFTRNENIPEESTQYLFFFVPSDPIANLGVNDISQIEDFDIMLNAGSTALPYEPYTDGKPTPSSEYPQPITNAGDGGSIVLTISNNADQNQSLTVSTPAGLPGIPVNSGGNYTDAEGKQSACDVKDYGTGKYTQMVGHIESYNGENITTPYMSTTGQLSTGAEVYYVLDEPVVTDISTEELTAYRALHTYDGATVVSTAENVAGLEVKYLADGEKYVERIVSQKAPEAAVAHTMALLADGIREGVNGV